MYELADPGGTPGGGGVDRSSASRCHRRKWRSEKPSKGGVGEGGFPEVSSQAGEETFTRCWWLESWYG